MAVKYRTFNVLKIIILVITSSKHCYFVLLMCFKLFFYEPFLFPEFWGNFLLSCKTQYVLFFPSFCRIIILNIKFIFENQLLMRRKKSKPCTWIKTFIELFTCLAPVFTFFLNASKKNYFAISLFSHIFITDWPVKLLYCSALKYTSLQHTKTYFNYSALLLLLL